MSIYSMISIAAQITSLSLCKSIIQNDLARANASSPEIVRTACSRWCSLSLLLFMMPVATARGQYDRAAAAERLPVVRRRARRVAGAELYFVVVGGKMAYLIFPPCEKLVEQSNAEFESGVEEGAGHWVDWRVEPLEGGAQVPLVLWHNREAVRFDPADLHFPEHPHATCRLCRWTGLQNAPNPPEWHVRLSGSSAQLASTTLMWCDSAWAVLPGLSHPVGRKSSCSH